MTDTTLLSLQGIGVPPYSARGLTQSLDPIDIASNLYRTINGELIDFGSEQFQKYKSAISGNDQQPPAVDGVWPGKIIIVDCIPELCYEESNGPSRDAVHGSERTESGFVFYRPQLTMMVMNFSTTKDEYGAMTSWTLELEEV